MLWKEKNSNIIWKQTYFSDVVASKIKIFNFIETVNTLNKDNILWTI